MRESVLAGFLVYCSTVAVDTTALLLRTPHTVSARGVTPLFG